MIGWNISDANFFLLQIGIMDENYINITPMGYKCFPFQRTIWCLDR